jgi:hypothetical protein
MAIAVGNSWEFRGIPLFGQCPSDAAPQENKVPSSSSFLLRSVIGEDVVTGQQSLAGG